MAIEPEDSIPEIGIPDAAHRLHETWHRTWRRVLQGELAARRNADGKWRVDARSVARLMKERDEHEAVASEA